MTQTYYVCSKTDLAKGWMNGCIVWWKAEGKGYTYDLAKAGVFTEEDRKKGYPPERNCHWIPKDLAEERAYRPMLVWWDDPDHRDNSLADGKEWIA